MFFEFIMDKGRRFENDQGKRWKLGISVFSPVSWNPKQNAAVQQRHKDRFFKCQNFTLKKSWVRHTDEEKLHRIEWVMEIKTCSENFNINNGFRISSKGELDTRILLACTQRKSLCC